MAVFVSAVVPSVVAQGAEYHISDEVTVFMHTGPSNQYRIRANIASGTMLDLLARDKATGYSKVRLASGGEGWVQSKYLDKGQSQILRLPQIEQQLARSRQVINEQGEALNGIEADLKKANDKQARFTAETAQLHNEVERLNLQINGMDETNLMGWFLRGGALALGGVIIGLILPHFPKRRRRNNDWF
jgi:SH3 domain protein